MPARSRSAARSAAWLLPLALLASVASISGCSASPSADRDAAPDRAPSKPARSGPVVPLEDRIDHVLGTVLLLPVSIAPASDLARPGPVEVLLEDGRDVGARLSWISVQADPTEHARWLAPAGRWIAITDPDANDPRAKPGVGAGFWAVTTHLPIDGAGQGIWIEGSLVELNWLAPPPAPPPVPSPAPPIAPSKEALHPALAPVHPGASGSPAFSALIQPERSSPVRRWRATLVTEGLQLIDPVQAESRLTDLPLALSSDPLTALAAQQEARWAVALTRLWHDDPDLCAQLRRSLGAVATFDSGVLAPVWSPDTGPLDELLFALLNPRATTQSRTRAASLFLADQPVGVCWVQDDAGRVDASTGRALATVGLTNLSERATLAWAAPPSADVAPALEPLAPRTTMMLTSETTPARVEGLGEVSAHVGRWGVLRTTIAEPLPVRPPGLRMGPLAPGWTLAEWLGGEEPKAGAGDTGWTTAALLERMPGSDGAWTIYVECLRPASSANDSDSVRIWLGPLTRPTSVLRITRDGSLRDELSSGSRAALIGEVRATPDRWSFRVALPPDAIPDDGSLMIAMERLSTGGRRWSWPRPMMPWQAEPGRLRVDLNAWE